MIEIVPAALDGERIDRIVALLMGCSRAAAAALVDDGAVLLDGSVVPAGKVKARAGQEMEITGAPDLGPAPPSADAAVPVAVVHADEAVVVVDKPEGLVVHPGAGNPAGTLVNGLLARFPEIAAVGDSARPGIVHRLDRGTSGLLVVARSTAAYRSLVAQLAERSVEREYVALAWGVPEAASGLIDAPVGRSTREPTRMTVAVDGRDARTRYAVERSFTEPVSCALLACRLETGRTHQIRVHLAAIGHPVVGDATYGGVRPGLDAPRPLLHARRLAFTHPSTGERCTFERPMPDDMAAVVARCH